MSDQPMDECSIRRPNPLNSLFKHGSLLSMHQNTPSEGIQMKRYALVSAPATAIEPYLPSNYQAIQTPDNRTVIEGRDSAGWTLDGYVIPRLASGLYFAEEIDLSHPVMKTI